MPNYKLQDRHNHVMMGLDLINRRSLSQFDGDELGKGIIVNGTQKFQLNVSVGQRVVLGLGVILAMMLVIGGISWRGMDRLAGVTEDMYQHPLAVSNAVLDANANIIAIHRSMKDVALAKTPEQIDRAVAEVELAKARVLEAFFGGECPVSGRYDPGSGSRNCFC
jgi:hypothetical protein